MSGVTGEGVTDVLRALRAKIIEMRAAEAALGMEAEPWQP
jgi:GTP-binding protein